MHVKRLFFLLSLALLTACAPGGAGQTAESDAPAESAPSDEVVQLVYQDWRTDWFPGMAQAQLAEFHATHPNIRVFYTPDPEDVPGEMPAMFRAGSAADVISGCCDFFPAWGQAGYLLDLRPFVERDLAADVIAEWDAAQYKAFFTADGRQFALPKYHGALAVYYNKDRFDAAGVPYPDADWTYDDYLSAMTALTGAEVDGSAVYGSTLDPIYDRVQIHVNAFGGHFVNPDDPTDCVLDEPPAVAALEWLRVRFQDDGVMASPLALNKLETRRAFWEGRVAMVEDGSWALLISRGTPTNMVTPSFVGNGWVSGILLEIDCRAICQIALHGLPQAQQLRFALGRQSGPPDVVGRTRRQPGERVADGVLDRPEAQPGGQRLVDGEVVEPLVRRRNPQR